MRREPAQIASDLYNDYFTRNRRKQERMIHTEESHQKMLQERTKSNIQK